MRESPIQPVNGQQDRFSRCPSLLLFPSWTSRTALTAGKIFRTLTLLFGAPSVRLPSNAVAIRGRCKAGGVSAVFRREYFLRRSWEAPVPVSLVPMWPFALVFHGQLQLSGPTVPLRIFIGKPRPHPPLDQYCNTAPQRNPHQHSEYTGPLSGARSQPHIYCFSSLRGAGQGFLAECKSRPARGTSLQAARPK